MDEEEIRNDELTPEEAEEVEETGMSGEEAHRFDEFEELRGLLADVLAAVHGLREDVVRMSQNAAAVAVESGAVVEDDGETASIDLDDYEDVNGDLDLTIN